MTFRQGAIEATRILNTFIGDIVIGSRCIELFEKALKGKKISNGMRIHLARLVFFHLILILAKWLEFYEKYKQVIPNDIKSECKALTKEIKKRKVAEFRNKYLGHIWDNDTQAPLETSQVNQFMAEITKGNSGEFLLWMNNPSENKFPKTVISIVSELRNRIRDDNKLLEEEISPAK
jgi:hypothetical protein